MFAEPSGAGDDLAVVEVDRVSWFRNDGTGAFADPVVSIAGDFSAMGPRRVDLDSKPRLDIVAGGGISFGAYLVAENGPSMTIQPRVWSGSFPAYNEINDFLVGGDLARLSPDSAATAVP